MKNNEISWLGTPEDRILSIRKFRKHIEEIPFNEAIDTTKNIWEGSPKINKLYFDISKVSEWPSPWDLFSQNSYCSNSKTLGAFYTLILSKHNQNHDIKLVVLNDNVFGESTIITADADENPTNATLVVGEKDIYSKIKSY
jgi:hypothetical protein